MEVADSAIDVRSRVNLLALKLTDLQNRFEDYSVLPDKWDCSLESFERCKRELGRNEVRLTDVNSSWRENTKFEIRSLLEVVEKSLDKAKEILDSMESEYTNLRSSENAGGSRNDSGSSWRRISLRRLCVCCVSSREAENPRLSFNVDRVKSALGNFDEIWKEALLSIESISHTLDNVDEMSTVKTTPDTFVEWFDNPLLPKNAVLNFVENSMEGRLKREVLSESGRENVTVVVGCSLHNVVGMGGVGKTVALQGLCRDLEVRAKYRDGVFFLKLGKNATEKDVIDGMAEFVKCSGGKSTSKKIEGMMSAERAAKEATVWFKQKCVLFVCDDIWSWEGSGAGFVSVLKYLLRNSTSSAMVISTRDSSILRHHCEVKFSSRKPQGKEALNILCKYANIEHAAVDQQSKDWGSVRYILDVCAGLPAALGIGGSMLRIYQERSGSIGSSVKTFAKKLKENVVRIGEENLEEYRAMKLVIETSLQHCEDWAQSAEGREKLGRELKVREKFEALCVLRKQAFLPEACVRRLWDTDERASEQLMVKLADLNLVERRCEASRAGVVDGLALHDLVLEHAQRLSRESKRSSLWHSQILDGYMPKACNALETCERYCREWWDFDKLRGDGYMNKNLCWHLGKIEGDELEWLLSDVRWSIWRIDFGGIVGLRDDFRELLHGDKRSGGAEDVFAALEESWLQIRKNRNSIPFEMWGRLQSLYSKSNFTRRFLSSVSMHIPKPHLILKREIRWAASSGQVSRFDFEDDIIDFAWSEERNRVALVQGEEILVFDLETLVTERILKGHTDEVCSVAISARGSRIVSGSEDKTIRVWDGNSGVCLLAPSQGHGDAVICIGMNVDGSRIVSGSGDKTIRVWDGNSGDCVMGPLEGHEDSVRCIGVNGDGTRIVSGSDDKTIRVWDGKSGVCVLGPLEGHDDAVSCIKINSDGSRIFSGSRDTTIRVYDAASGECLLGPLRGHDDSVRCIEMNGDGSRIVSGSDDKTIRVWDGNSGDCVLGPLRGHVDSVSCIGMNGADSRIVSGSADKTIRVWDGNSGECLFGQVQGQDDSASCIGMNGDGSRIVSGSHGNTIRVWDGNSGELLFGPLQGHNGAVLCIEANGDGSRIVSGSDDKTIRVWDGKSGDCVLGPLMGHVDSVSCVGMNGDGSRIVSGSDDKTIRIWDGNNGECVLGPLRGHADSVSCIGVNGDGSRIVSGSWDTTIRVWDGNSGECVLGPLKGHDRSVSCIGINGDGSQIVSGSWDTTIRVWDSFTGANIGKRVEFAGWCKSAKFEAGGVLCVVRSSEEVVVVNTANGTKVHRSGDVHCAGDRIFVTEENGTKKQVASMPQHIRSWDYNRLYGIVVADLSDGQVVIANVSL